MLKNSFEVLDNRTVTLFNSIRFLSLVVLALCCCLQALSSCKWATLCSSGFSLWSFLLLWSTDSRFIVSSSCGLGLSSFSAHTLVAPLACGILLDQGSYLWLLHWQVDFHPLYHQEGPNQHCLWDRL